MQLNLFHPDKKNKTDEEILQFYFETHNPDYLGGLYERYIYLVYGVCLKYLKNKNDAKDAVIDVYEKIQRGILKHRIKNFKSWLYVVTKNHCLMQLRANKKEQTQLTGNDFELEKIMENQAELHPVEKEPDEYDENVLNECLEKLKTEQKKCIQLFYFKSKSYRQIAASLNMDEKKVKSNIQNGKRNLKNCLGQKR